MKGLHSLVATAYPARPVGLVRVAIGVIAVVRGGAAFWILWPLTDPTIVNVPLMSWIPGPTPTVVLTILGVWLTAAGLFAIGFHTRLAGSVLVAAMTGALVVDQQAYSNHLYLLIVMVGLLTIAGPGGAFSVDAMRNDVVPPMGWPIVLMKLQISVVYLYAALTKINATYLAGSILSVQVGRGLLPATWAAESRPLMQWAAIASVVVEIVIGLYLWHPRRRFVAIGAGVLLHGAIVLLMPSPVLLGVFAGIMLASYLLFIPPDAGGRAVEGRGPLMARLQRHDLLSLLAIKPGAILSTTRGSDTDRGWRALLCILDELPISYLWAPFLRLVPPQWASRRLNQSALGGEEPDRAADSSS